MPWPKPRFTNALAVAIACGAIALVAATFLIGSTPDEEEFRFAILSAWLRVDALRHGSLGLWSSALGLGLPQPFTPAFLLHPLLPLLAIMSPVTWVRVLLLCHVLLGAAGMWQVTRYLRLSAIAGAVCVSTFLLATPTQNYILSDFWPSHFIMWTTAPWLLWITWRLLDAGAHARPAWSISLGLASGLVLANTNPGHAIVYAPVIVAIAATSWRRIRARAVWVALAAVMAAAIASPSIAQLAHEWRLFDVRLPKWSVPEPLPLVAAWNAIVSPFGVDLDRTPFTRTLFFGGPFLVLAVMGALRHARRRADLVFIVIAASILLFTGLLPFSLVSARSQFRDPLTLAAIPLAGLALDDLFATRGRRVVGVLAVVVQLAVLCASAWPALARTWISDARRAEWFHGATGSAVSADALVTLAQPAGRIVFSPAIDKEMYGSRRLWEGLGVNALAYRGMPVVNGWFKGVSTGTIWPDERQFYGRVRVPEQLLASRGSLDVLGIRYVVTTPDEPAPAGMQQRGTIPTKNGHFVLYENSGAWPGLFVVDLAAAGIARARLPGCENDRVLCTDLTPLTGFRADVPRVRGSDGDLTVRMLPVDRPRLLVLTQMFRGDWVASTDAGRLRVTPVFGGLIGVRIPAGVTAVRLRYRPLAVMLTTALAWSTLGVGIAALIGVGKRRRREMRRAAVSPVVDATAPQAGEVQTRRRRPGYNGKFARAGRTAPGP